MNKKRLAAVLSVAFTGLIAVSFAGCDLFDGLFADSRFPYDIAAERGYEGSEESWLASLDTPSTRERRLYEEALADGYEGSFFEFLKGLGLSAADDTLAVNEALRSVVAIEALHRSGANANSYSLSMGSGVVYAEEDGDLYVVTNYHVVYDDTSSSGICKSIYLYLYGSIHKGDGRVYSRALTASYVGGAMDYDLAVLKVDSDDVVTETSGDTHTNGDILKDSDYLELRGADSDSVTVGERVYAIGNAEGEGISVTAGVISVAAEYINIDSADDSRTISLLEMRTDAPVNHGNSGGGLFNAQGELLGIVNARGEGEGAVGFGYAIPANLALSVAQNILDNRAGGSKGAMRATIGIHAQATDSKAVYNVETGKYYIEEKVVVTGIDGNNKAYKAGLQTNDTIVSITHKKAGGGERTIYITRLYKLTNYLFEIRLGDTLVLSVTRTNEEAPIDVEITFDTNSDFTLFQ